MAAVTALARFYALPDDPATVQALLDGPAFARNAKDGKTYGAADRVREHETGAALHADEIDKVVIWAEAVARTAGVALDPPAPLLG